MKGLITWFSQNRIASNLLMLMIMLSGMLSIPQVNKEFFPASDIKTVRITVPYPGAAPINVEEQICIRVEQAIDGLEGIDKITSNAKQNSCQVDVEAADNYDIQTLLNNIKNRVDAIDNLPDDAKVPQVTQLTSAFQMMQLALSGNVNEATLKRHARQIKKELEALDHVSTVIIEGTRDYEISIEINQSTLRQYKLSFEEVRQSINLSSIDLPLGSLPTQQGTVLLQGRTLASNSEDFGDIVIRKSSDGSVVYLRDIAIINDGFVESHFISHFNQKPAVFFKVQVTDNPDIVNTHHIVSAYLKSKQAQLPETLTLSIWHTFYKSFKGRVHTLMTNGASGLLLVFIVLMLFLRPLLALWVCIGIGIAFLGTLWLLPLVGTSLNMISLFAFLMILGIIVDDAIIVSESIYSEQQKHGNGIISAINGTHRVYKPVLYAVISTMLVFLPMLFLPGKSAKSSQAIPTVVLLTLAFSLIECLFILPSHLAEMPPEGHFKNRIIRTFDQLRKLFSNALETFVHKYYKPTLQLCLNHYSSSIAFFFVAMCISLSIFTGGWLTFSFLPNVDTDHIVLQVKLSEGEPIEFLEDLSQTIEEAAVDIQNELFFDDVLVNGKKVSYIENFVVRSNNTSVYAVLGLNRQYKQTIPSPEIIHRWRNKIGPIPQAEEVDYSYQINSLGKPLQYRLASDDNESLAQANEALQAYLGGFAGVFNIGDSLKTPRSEVEFNLKSSSQLSAWNMDAITTQLRHAFYGVEAQRISRDEEDIAVMLRLSLQERIQHESINSLPIRDDAGNLSRLDAITDIHYVPALQEIERVNRKRTLTVSADLLKGSSDITDISKAVSTQFKDRLQAKWPNVDLYLEGAEQERAEFLSVWRLLFMQALLVIYAMMAIVFRSYWQPVIILTAIPFGVMGAIFGHLIMGKDISIFSFLGVMACAGVVVNDNLVLIDRINQLRDQAMNTKNAIIQAGIDRFRPIILTSATTFIGLLPIMSETSLQAQFLIPMVISLAFGVLFATVVTLLLVPCLYLMGERCKERIGHWISMLKVKIE